jgi:putative glutamine amidotransferase
VHAAPLIGLSGRRWPVRLLGDAVVPAMAHAEFDLHFADYPRAIAACGGLPVELAREADVDGVVGRLDGLVLTGGADVDPAVYGETPDPDLGAVEAARDRWELSLLAAAEATGLPVLCVCRGAQLLNVAHGGTLRQHVEVDEGDGHPRFAEDGRRPAHAVDLVDGSLAASLLGAHADVNSLHHQVIDRVGEGLAVSGRSPDGTVEAIELTGRDVLGVQWHPELLAGPDPTFEWLVEAAARRLGATV